QQRRRRGGGGGPARRGGGARRGRPAPDRRRRRARGERPARPCDRNRADRDARRHLAAAEGLPQLRVVLLRYLQEPIGELVLDAALRQPAEDARLPRTQEGRPRETL